MGKTKGISILLILLACTAIESKFPPRFTRENSDVRKRSLNAFKQLSVADNNANISYRLPSNTSPHHYVIELTTHIHESKFEFEGHVTIYFTVKSAPLNEITLHVRHLKNLKIDLFNINGNKIESDLQYEIDEDRDFLKVNTTNDLVIDMVYVFEISYAGELRDDNLGFYRSSYTNARNQTVWIATTQFESVEARSAFPCWDEPQIRTTFEIKITHGDNYKAISNMPEKTPTRSSIPGYVTTTFEKSFPIQTYLVAFIVSDFKNIIDSTKPITQRVFAKPESIDSGHADVALKYGQEILTKLAEYLSVPYFNGSLLKMDQFALPDFDAGAMENFGLVTYREEYLLHNKIIDTTEQKETVLTIISHEFAHMYFGDLVAPQWWSYLWLNEGFATLYEFYLVSLIYKSDRIMDSFLLNVVHPVLEIDGHITRPMTHYVEDPDDIDDLFDWIAYEKSGSVLRMIQNAIGDDTWRKGLNYYLKERSFKEATPNDLHTSLQKALNEDGLEALDIAKIMLSWETQSGYPLINVDISDGNLTFTQERFLYDLPESPSEGLWYVPINYITASDSVISTTNADLWMNQQKLSFSRKNAPKYWNDDDWIIVNLQQGYYYRVNYDKDLWALLIAQLNSHHDKIDLRNRAQLIDDSFNLARAGIISYDITFGIISYLKNEIDYVPWQTAHDNILLLNNLLSGLNMHKKFQSFMRKLVEPFYINNGHDVIDNEHKFKRYARTIALNLACSFEHESCLNLTKSRVEESSIHPDLQEAIYSNGLRYADKETFEKIVEKMLNSKYQAQRTVLIRALASTQNEELLYSFLMLTLKNEPRLRLQEKYRIFRSIPNAGAVGAKVAMKFIQENYETINSISSSVIRSILNNITPLISSDDPIKQFNQLLDFLLSKEAINENYKASLLEIVNSTKIWQDKHAKKIEEWLDINGSTTNIISIVVLAFAFVLRIFL